MFTGLIEAVGIVSNLTGTSSGFRLAIQTPLAAELRDGESVAVNGVCLTATTHNDAGWSADIGPETARVTTLAQALREAHHVAAVRIANPGRGMHAPLHGARP